MDSREKDEIVLETYKELLDVLETSLPLLNKNRLENYGEVYLAGFEGSFNTVIEYLEDIIEDIEIKMDT